ncbi:hypothetical protein Bbelb_394820 [Branchiostoma belcheri]|nr:hypothetical protein Bbelb_394820 [Branchiostoma belcheri]
MAAYSPAVKETSLSGKIKRFPERERQLLKTTLRSHGWQSMAKDFRIKTCTDVRREHLVAVAEGVDGACSDFKKDVKTRLELVKKMRCNGEVHVYKGGNHEGSKRVFYRQVYVYCWVRSAVCCVPNRALSQTMPGHGLGHTARVPNRASGLSTVWDMWGLSRTVPDRAQFWTHKGLVVSQTVPVPFRTVWDTRRVSQTMPKHGLGQGIRVSQTMLSPQARFGTRAECLRPCPSMVWDKAMACPELCST